MLYLSIINFENIICKISEIAKKIIINGKMTKIFNPSVTFWTACIFIPNNLVIWHQVFLSNMNIIFVNRSIWPIYGTLIDTTTPGQSEPRSNGNKGVLHSPEQSDAV